MKGKVISIVVIGVFLSAFVFPQMLAAQQTGQLTTSKHLSTMHTIALEGTVIDNACAQSAGKNIGSFIKTHTKTCALMPACLASGYSIFAKGRLYRFDSKSSAKVAEFLKNSNTTLNVRITAEENGKELKLLTIENVK